jgi:hypothetical protein
MHSDHAHPESFVTSSVRSESILPSWTLGPWPACGGAWSPRPVHQRSDALLGSPDALVAEPVPQPVPGRSAKSASFPLQSCHNST